MNNANNNNLFINWTCIVIIKDLITFIILSILHEFAKTSCKKDDSQK